jgi:hypothetical protein
MGDCHFQNYVGSCPVLIPLANGSGVMADMPETLPRHVSTRRDPNQEARAVTPFEPIAPIPEETARVARASCPPGPWARTRRDARGTRVTNDEVATRCPACGPPAEAPWHGVSPARWSPGPGLGGRPQLVCHRRGGGAGRRLRSWPAPATRRRRRGWARQALGRRPARTSAPRLTPVTTTAGPVSAGAAPSHHPDALAR